MVEHLLAKEKAAGSNPVFRSILFLASATLTFVSPNRVPRIGDL